MDIGTLLLMVAFAYGLGVLWYDLLPGEVSMKPWRVAAYPFAAMVIAEVLVVYGPMFGGFHVLSAIGASLIGVLVDWGVNLVRHPKAVEYLEKPLVATTRA
ncbi:MAG: hypothetical protein HYU86_04340 [Chloroflexi bacterium]|nr:hypothetical protein [Chloroflexota bacterium]